MIFYSARKSRFVTQPSKLVQITKIGKVKEKKSRQTFFFVAYTDRSSRGSKKSISVLCNLGKSYSPGVE